MPLNPEQELVADHLTGPLRVGAVAGSGKTTALIERVGRLVQNHGIRPNRILVISFSRAAKEDVAKRLDKRVAGVSLGKCARTFHSIGLDIYKTECGDKGAYIDNTGILWLKTMSQAYRAMGMKGEKKVLKTFASFVKNEMLGTNEVLRRLGKIDPRMLEAARGICSSVAGGVAPEDVIEAFYRAEDIRENDGILHKGEVLRFVTFDDMIYQSAMALRRSDVRDRWGSRWDYVLQDECQDENVAQASIAEALCHKHRNYMVVGDPSQCHPPGVAIEVEPGEEVPIESLSDGDRIRSWNRNAQKMIAGRSIETSVRSYEGDLIHMEVDAPGGERSVPMTPNHRVLCRWTNRDDDVCVTYLMYRANYGYRVGWCKLFARGGDGSIGFHLRQRAQIEKAEKVWILANHRSRTDASVYESVVSVKWQIPTITFEPVHGAVHITREAIDRIFSGCRSSIRGDECLHDHGLHEDLPLWPFPSGGVRSTYFEVYAANLQPGLMSVPVTDLKGRECWRPITNAPRSEYEGPVYSLNVEKDHSYSANGVVVMNCIYMWRGANPQKIINFEEEWPDAKTIVMHRNYRSGIEIVELANAIVDHMPASTVITDDMGFASDITSERQTHSYVGYHQFTSSEAEADAVATNILAHHEAGSAWKDQTILVRQNFMTLDLELSLATQEIPYKLMASGASFFDLKETKLVLGYLRMIAGRGGKEDFAQAILFPTRGVSRTFVNKVAMTQEDRECDWLDALREHLAGAPRGAAQWLEVIDSMRHLKSRTPSQIVVDLYQLLLLDDWFSAEGDADADGGSSSSNLSAVRDLASRFDTLDDMLNTIQKMEAHRRANIRKRDIVILSTVHRAKGREWPVVYVPQLGGGLFPTSNGDPHEERRVFYVACTRAMDELWLSGPATNADGATIEESAFVIEVKLKTEDWVPGRVVQDPEPVGTQMGLEL